MHLIKVAAAAIQNKKGQVLLSRRHPDSHQGDLWEFPGGKLESGESVPAALHRELQEELGIQVTQHRPLIRILHDYPDCRILLDVHLVTAWQGEPGGLENQPLRWVSVSELDSYPMPAADVPIIRALQLPSLYLITSPQANDATQFLESLKHALEHGVGLLQFRVFGLEKLQLRALAQRSLDLCQAYSARMLINHDLQLSKALGADGVHLTAHQLQTLDSRPLPTGRLVSASCHSLTELQQAHRLGVDFVVLSPVLPTRSHPDADPLGWDGFVEIVNQANMPVYALGGMQVEYLQKAWASGAQGISGISMKLN